VFQAPEAVLFDADGNVVGIHYAGPTWESNSAALSWGCAGREHGGFERDPVAAASGKNNARAGNLRPNDLCPAGQHGGGTAPATAGTALGQVARVPYTAEYYFYRATH